MPQSQFGFIGQKWPVMVASDAGKVLVVNTDEDGFDLAALAASLPSVTTGDALKVVRVNAAEDGYELAVPGQSMTLLTQTAAFDITNTHLNGLHYITANFATNLVITVPSGLTGTEPVSLIRYGTGTVTFAAGAGVTIRSRGSLLAIAAQYAAVTLVPKGSNVYDLIGALV